MKFAARHLVHALVLARVGQAAARMTGTGLVDSEAEVGFKENAQEPHSSTADHRRLQITEVQCSEDPAPVNGEPLLYGLNWELNANATIASHPATDGQYFEIPGYYGKAKEAMPFARTVQKFQRPLKVSVEMKHNPADTAIGRCLSLQLYATPQCHEVSPRYCGYQAGFSDWWTQLASGEYVPQFEGREYEFVGYTNSGDGGQTPMMSPYLDVWQIVTVDLLEDGTNNYYLNGALKWTTTTPSISQYTGMVINEGHIALQGCTDGQFRNLQVTGNQCATPSSEPSLMPSDSASSPPSISISTKPSLMPSDSPSSPPSISSSTQPSLMHSDSPSSLPTSLPSPSPSKPTIVNLFYPDWVHGSEGCMNDGNEPNYMTANPTEWLSSTVEACCEKFFGGYMYEGCMGSYSPGEDSISLFYPDWQGANKGCIDDGKEPYYMLSNHEFFLSNTREDCCKTFYPWDYFSCAGTTPPLTQGVYYPDWTGASATATCLNDGNVPAYMLENQDYYLSTTLQQCCERHFHFDVNACLGLFP